jgi:ribosomal protein S18 acetylase RimI-like enzyme
MTAAVFKRSIRDLQVWCSSCMVAFSGPDPIGVLIGAKRPSGTLIHRIAVHPDHVRQGHARHLLDSLASKLAILGPPRIFAEVPERFTAACSLFTVSGFAKEALLTDYVLERGENDLRQAEPLDGRFVIPVSLDDLAANGLLEETHPQACWQRAIETLSARKNDLAGLALASDEQIDAYLMYAGSEIVTMRSLVDDGGAGLKRLLSRLPTGIYACAKVHPDEFPAQLLETVGFHPAHAHLLYTSTAQSS